MRIRDKKKKKKKKKLPGLFFLFRGAFFSIDQLLVPGKTRSFVVMETILLLGKRKFIDMILLQSQQICLDTKTVRLFYHLQLYFGWCSLIQLWLVSYEPISELTHIRNDARDEKKLSYVLHCFTIIKDDWNQLNRVYLGEGDLSRSSSAPLEVFQHLRSIRHQLDHRVRGIGPWSPHIADDQTSPKLLRCFLNRNTMMESTLVLSEYSYGGFVRFVPYI